MTTLKRLALLWLLLLMGGTGSRSALAQTLPAVISGGADHAIKRWDPSGKLVATIGTHDDTVNAIALVPGDLAPTLVSVGSDGALKLWNIDEARLISSLDAHKEGATALAISPDGKLIATGGADDYIRLWDRAIGKRLYEVKAHSDTVRSLAFNADGSVLFSGSADRTLRIWKVVHEGRNTLLVYQSNIIAHDAPVTVVALAPNEQTIASVAEDGYLKTWRRSGGGLADRTRINDRVGVTAMAFSPDGRLLATGDEEGKIRIWNTSTGAPLPFNGSHERAVYALAWAADSKILVSGGADKTLRYWNVTNGQLLRKITAHDGAVKTIVILP